VGHASGSLATWKDGGCWVRAGELGAAEPNSVLRPGFPADGYWLCWMRLSHFSSVTSDRASGSCCSYLEIPDSMLIDELLTPNYASTLVTHCAACSQQLRVAAAHSVRYRQRV
jgi:hypothetical protein